MSQSIDSIEFGRGVIQPVECIREGYELIRDQYWLFVGMAAIGVLIGNAVPFGILMGPMVVGLYMALFRKRRGELVEFGILFKGFDTFGDSVVVTIDRKSTRLNSSHGYISYAVFCLKKKIKKLIIRTTSSDDAENSKPDPDIVVASLKKTGCAKDQTIMLDDTPYNVAAALPAWIEII